MKSILGDKGTLSGLASRAFAWSFLSTILSRFGLTGFGVLLARLLGPQEFGTAAVGWVALLAILSFNELGVSLAIVRWPGEPDEIAPTVATISVVTSLLLYGGLYEGAPAFADAMGAPAAASIVRVLGLGIVTSGIVSVPAALLERHFRQDRKLIADQVHGWLGALVSVGFAWAGFGAMSIAIGSIAGAVAGTVIIVIYSPLPLRFGFDRSKARQLMRFGLPLAGSSLIVFLVGNVDNFTVGHVLGATSLGFYVLAWNLASFPVNMFSQPVRSVAPAMFSRLQHDPGAMRTGFTSAVALLGTATLPVCLLIGGAGVPLIKFVYGASWVSAAQPLVWLALLGALRVLFELSYDYFVVLARSRVVFTIQLVWLLVLIPLLTVAAKLDGIVGVAIAGLAAAALVVLPWYLIELRRVGIRIGTIAVQLVQPIVAAGVVGTVAFSVSRVVPNDFAACAISGVAALIVMGLLAYRMRPAIATLRTALRSDSTAGGDPAPDHVAIETSPALAAPGEPPTRARPSLEAQAAAVRQLLALATPQPGASSALTGPMPVIRDVPRALPVYDDVVTALQRDAATRSRGDADGRGINHKNARHRPFQPVTPPPDCAGDEVTLPESTSDNRQRGHHER